MEPIEDSPILVTDLSPNLAEDDIGRVSDGYHTFDSLYRQRCVLFACLVGMFPDISWKSRRHEDGEPCFGGEWFIVGIDTPEGSYTYHYPLGDWDMFRCPEIERGLPWDGHTDKDVERLLSLVELVDTQARFV